MRFCSSSWVLVLALWLAPVDTVDAQTREYLDAGLKGVTQYLYGGAGF